MTPIVVQTANDEVVWSGQINAAAGQDIEVRSATGSSRAKIPAYGQIVLIVLPTTDKPEEYTPPPEGQMAFQVETADSAQERTEKEMEENRVDGTIRPQDMPSQNLETVQELVSMGDPPVEETEESTEPEPVAPTEEEPLNI